MKHINQIVSSFFLVGLAFGSITGAHADGMRLGVVLGLGDQIQINTAAGPMPVSCVAQPAQLPVLTTPLCTIRTYESGNGTAYEVVSATPVGPGSFRSAPLERDFEKLEQATQRTRQLAAQGICTMGIALSCSVEFSQTAPGNAGEGGYQVVYYDIRPDGTQTRHVKFNAEGSRIEYAQRGLKLLQDVGVCAGPKYPVPVYLQGISAAQPVPAAAAPAYPMPSLGNPGRVVAN
ncbi:MAG: hypothetical protein HY074_19405 [Deltaproteobacteria bacterium]|nr:hypothetical protein [Deltaproteobacteria bacterium]